MIPRGRAGAPVDVDDPPRLLEDRRDDEERLELERDRERDDRSSSSSSSKSSSSRELREEVRLELLRLELLRREELSPLLDRELWAAAISGSLTTRNEKKSSSGHRHRLDHEDGFEGCIVGIRDGE